MLAPTRSNPQSATAADAIQPPDPFGTLLAAARIEALILLRNLLHAPLTSAAETRERRLAATAILRIPAPVPSETPSAPAETAPTRTIEAPRPEPHPPAPIPRAQPPVKQATDAKPTAAAPLSPRPARSQVARVLAAAGADSS